MTKRTPSFSAFAPSHLAAKQVYSSGELNLIVRIKEVTDTQVEFESNHRGSVTLPKHFFLEWINGIQDIILLPAEAVPLYSAATLASGQVYGNDALKVSIVRTADDSVWFETGIHPQQMMTRPSFVAWMKSQGMRFLHYLPPVPTEIQALRNEVASLKAQLANAGPRSKDLKDLTFKELVAFGIELEVDSIVAGRTLSQRVWELMNTATTWCADRSEKVGANYVPVLTSPIEGLLSRLSHKADVAGQILKMNPDGEGAKHAWTSLRETIDSLDRLVEEQKAGVGK